jgi:sodium-dependent phosphate cotransporter
LLFEFSHDFFVDFKDKMKTAISEQVQKEQVSLGELFSKFALLLFALGTFLLSLELMVGAFRLIGEGRITEMLSGAANPFVGLFVGLLSTAIVQRSGLVTAMTVVLVGADILSLHNAVPIVMGANIGTTITCMIISMGHVTRKKEFRKAFAGSVLHVFFNLITAIVLFPIEYFWKGLTQLSWFIVSFIESSKELFSIDLFSFVRLIQPLSDGILALLDFWLWGAVILAVLMLVGSLKAFSILLKQLVVGKLFNRVESIVFATDNKALFFGTITTALLQSSSFVTSFIVTLVASNRFSLKKAFPFIMGANIGTTITALLASIGKPQIALTLAMVHVLFNLVGVLLLYPIGAVRNGLVEGARRIGRASVQQRLLGFVYVVLVFFIIPFLLIFFTSRA